jgi:peptidoglycan hydrolase-like protein with peptidoglycan-binding domain
LLSVRRFSSRDGEIGYLDLESRLESSREWTDLFFMQGPPSMTPLTVQQHPVARPRSLRRLMTRTACVSAVAVLGWSTASSTASAAPGLLAEVPLLQSGFAGLRVGAQGSDVISLQRSLIAAGINGPGGADGVFGPATRQAVVAFQTARSLPATGEVDQATSNALSSSGSGSSASGYVGLEQGARGDAVKEVQRRLGASGVYVAGGADGVYGAATARAVTQFQRWSGLTPTGAIDAKTASALGLGSSSSTSTPAPTTPPAVPSNNPYVGLKQGVRGDEVKALQVALQNTGVVVRGGADGVFGSVTATALKSFQKTNGISQTGVLTEQGAKILKLGTGGGTTTPPPASSPYLGLGVGARGAAVKDVQQALIAAGVTVRGGADGVFGNATKTALTSYQTSAGITADGTVNQATIDQLGLGSSRGPIPFASSTPPSPTPPPPATPPPSTSSNPYVGLTVGSRGTEVAELQRALQSSGLVVRGGADGVFGNVTKAALQAFQKVNGIPQTGVTTKQGVTLLALGSGGGQGAANPNSGVTVVLDRFPVQGRCFFGNTWGAARGGGRTHEGVDIIANEGNLLYAVTDGEITKLYWDQPGALAGNGFRLTQPNGTYFTYLHLSSFAPGIEVGTKVQTGDVIGFVGNTGSSATPHLHFEVHPGGGSAVNPYPYVKATDDCSNTTPQYQSSFT